MPSPPGGDPRDLLLGILALLNGFIDRDALAAAFGVWTTERKRPLAEILVERGAITPAHRQLLEQLANTLLARHGGDANSGLSALSEHFNDDDRTLLKSIDDASLGELRESLALLRKSQWLPAPEGSTEPMTPDGAENESATVQTPNPGEDRYRRGTYFRGGGLGQIHLALDREFLRTVALKTIRPRYAQSGVMRERFLLEAEITGNLEHPGIVPAYGLGTSSDGQPYYAMRLVKGRTFKERIKAFHPQAVVDQQAKTPADLRAGNRELRELIRHFVAVCQTVEYAHKRGVIHRDLKPANIMVGDYGETLVIDWGLAKATGQRLPADTEPEVSMFVPKRSGGSGSATQGMVGTPGHMAPEQYDEQGEKTTAAADLYALGTILYEILTGRGPFQELHKQADQIKDATLRGAFPPPRQVNATVPRPLEAICLMAMRLKPDDRYPSAANLADDVKRWQDDEPVSAMKETWSDRLGRWERKHRNAVRVGGAALAILASGALVAALAIAWAWGDARRQRDRALHNLDAVIALSDDLQRLSAGYLARVPASMRWRRTLAERCVETVESLEYERPGDHKVLRSAARARIIRAGLAPLERSFLADWARREEAALEDANAAIDQARRLAELPGSTASDKLLLAQMLAIRGGMHRDADRYDAADRDAAELLEILDAPEISETDPDSAAEARAVALRTRATVCLAKGEAAEAVRQAEAARNALVIPASRADDPTVDEDPLGSARLATLLVHAEANLGTGDRILALRDLDDAVALGRTLGKSQPFDLDIQVHLFLALTRRAELLGAESDGSIEAERELGETYTPLAKVRNGDGDILAYDLPLLQASNFRASAAHARGDRAGATRNLDRAAKLLSDLRRSRPPRAADLLEETRTESIRGRLARALGNHAEARDHLRRALATCERYRSALPPNAPEPAESAEIRRELTGLEQNP